MLLVALALLVPIVPFLGFGEALEASIATWLDPPPAPATTALVTFALLASDILLPIPSSLVNTFAGAQLGVLAATIVSWTGMTLGAVLGFALARRWGRSLAVRLSAPEDLEQLDHLGRRYGAWIVVFTRALPVLAEASVLLMGVTQLAWRQFLPAVMLSNLGIALAYSLLGAWAQSQHELPWALAASIALPIMAATIARIFLRQRESTSFREPPV